MKRSAFLFLIPLLLICSCDDWFEFDWTGEDTPGAYTDTPVDPVTPDTTIEDPFVLEDEEDAIDNTSFDRTISVVFAASGATVTGDENGIVTVSGNCVTVNNTGSEKIRYELSGTASDGFFKIYGEKKQAIVLKDLNLTNPNGAAINNQNKKRTFVVLQGSNTLADGQKYTATPEEEDEKAAFFSEAQLVFSGSGSLAVTAIGKAGITSDDYVRVLGDPTISINSTGGHGLRGKDAVVIGGLERGAHLSQACYAANWSRDTWYALYSDNTVAFVFKTPSTGANGMVVSTAGEPALLGGVTVSGGTPFFGGMANEGATVAGGSQITVSAYSSGSAMGGPGGMGPGGPGGFGPGR